MSVGADGYLVVVAIGCSWGGLDAVEAVLDRLPSDLQATVIVVQHRAHAPSDLASLLGGHTPWAVCEAEDKEKLDRQRVYLAPPGYHLLVDGGCFALSTEGPVQHSRPSIDVFFESVAEAFGAQVIGVVLTGANDDGAAGLADIARRGGAAVVQNPATALRPAMPAAALRAVPGAEVVDLVDIAAVVCRLVDERVGGPRESSR